MATQRNDIEEKELIRRLQSSDTAHDAFDELMRRYGEGVYWQIRKMVFNHDDAVDLLQNAFIKAWKNIDHFRGDARLTTWLYKIAINESINFLNKEKTRQGFTADDPDNFIINNLTADEYFDGDELHLALQKAIAALPEKQRLVFNMRYFDEMSYEQISDILGTSVGALKANYHHAVKKISQAISDLDS